MLLVGAQPRILIFGPRAAHDLAKLSNHLCSAGQGGAGGLSVNIPTLDLKLITYQCL